ncbi:hypothetical protein AR687_24350 [Flavobacteriaceae bacterium CRH]|nr:hypothetical protein AR687_24350 [Flavobacteriaceae bacterium CRH]
MPVPAFQNLKPLCKVITNNTYDEQGQITSKKVGNTIALPTQKVDYTYNIRGWLTAINDVTALSKAGDPKDLFAFKINYNNTPIITGGKALYNGNIAETFWSSTSDATPIVRGYAYLYDNLNRLKTSFYKRDAVISNAYSENLTYDKNGNINSIIRNGSSETTTQIDALAYTYVGTNTTNQLLKVIDSAPATSKVFGFIDSADNTLDDYSYEANGNMIKDNNKNITDITYNHLNLPTKITFATTGNIVYIYNATGQKIQKIVNETGKAVLTTDYLSGYQYDNNSLKFFPTAEGYVEPSGSSYKYVYQYKDHLGNVRLSYDKTLVIKEESNFYPFGLKQEGYNTVKTGVDNKYKYNGKELQDELGLNLYDFGARNYDPALGRWMNIDVMSEKYYPLSTYNYAINNPIFFIDPDGNEIDIYYGTDNKQKAKYAYQKDRDYSKIKDAFLADAYKALDALYTASNIKIDGVEVNVMQTLMNDERELSVANGGEAFGSHFAEGRSYEDRKDTSTRTMNNIGTIYFNTKEGNLYDDVNDTKGSVLQNLYDTNKLSKTTKIVSGTSILGHETIHAFDFLTNPSEYFKRRNDKSTQNQTPSFKNAEEAKATTLSNLINIKLKQPERNNYRAIGVPTQGVLSNKIR